MQNSKESGQFYKGTINYSLLARLKSKDHIREPQIFGYVCFDSEHLFSKSIFLESLSSESIFFRIHFFGIHFFGIHFFGFQFFGIHFLESIFSESILSESIFFGIHFFGIQFFGIHFRHQQKREKTKKKKKKKKNDKMVVCHFCVETVKISELIFSEPPILAFLIFWGSGEVHASIQVWGGWFVGGRGLAVKLSLVGLLGFWQRMFAGVSRGPREL